MADSKLGFAGKVAVVTGAGAGAGRAAALLLAEMGAKVVPVDIVNEIAEDAAAEIRAAGGEAMGASADVTDEARVQGLFDQTLDRFGRVDTLINNVGNMRGHKPSPIVDMDWEFWEVSVAQNLKSTFLCSQAAARAMIANQTKGAIVNIASLSGLRASVRLAPYGAAKAGVMQFTKTLAVELAPHGIRVNCVGPASINAPPGKTRLPQWRMDEMAKSIPLGRLSEPEDIAGIAVALASDLASFVTGQIVMCDGGLACTSSRPPMPDNIAMKPKEYDEKFA